MWIRTQLSENAATLRSLRADMRRAYEEEPHGPSHAKVCAPYHASYDALAFPGGLERFRQRLKRFEPDAIEEAIQFLEADPWFDGSGYVKEEIVRRLKQSSLADRQRNRLSAVVLRSMTTGTRRLSRHLARLAPIVDSAGFRKSVEVALQSDGESQRRAAHIVELLRSRRPLKQGR